MKNFSLPSALVSLLLAALLLTTTATAYAECAWVLWSRTGMPKAPLTDWTVAAAHQTEAACKSMLEGMLVAARQTFPNATRIGDSIHLRGADESYIMSSFYLCTPDTVDPRGPKGK